jgi:flavin reductase (DIM6/NTAB) family NADH-FMN oxidoreductase RutF
MLAPASDAPTPDHLTISPSVLYFGTPVVLIVTRNPDGTANITPMSSAWALGSSVVLGLLADGQGAGNLRHHGECTLNFPSAELWPRVERIARSTGRDPVPAYKAAIGYTHVADKFVLGGFTQQAAELVGVPRILECPLQFEARVKTLHEDEDRPDGAPRMRRLIVDVEVLRVHAHRDIVVPDTNHIDTGRWNPLFYVFRHYFGNAAFLGRTFKAEV